MLYLDNPSHSEDHLAHMQTDTPFFHVAHSMLSFATEGEGVHSSEGESRGAGKA